VAKDADGNARAATASAVRIFKAFIEEISFWGGA
jgi:hypothetical protein